MSLTIIEGQTAEKFSSESLVYTFDYDRNNLGAAAELASTGTFTIDPADGQLTKDNEDLGDGNRTVTVRLLGGKPGKTYVIRHQATTNESPPQTVKALFYLFIRPEQ